MFNQYASLNRFMKSSSLSPSYSFIRRQQLKNKPPSRTVFSRHLSGYWPTADGGSNMHGTTILSVRKGNKVVVIGDGQISQGNTIVKGTAVKVRKIGDGLESKRNSKDSNVVLAGFAGATADALTLLDRLERVLEQYPGQVTRSCVELAKAWRTDKYLRRLEAIMVVVDKDTSLTLTGNGDVLQSEDGIIAVGSGGLYALSAARALTSLENDMDAEEIGKRAMKVASDLCVFTNENYTIETLEVGSKDSKNENQEKNSKKKKATEKN